MFYPGALLLIATILMNGEAAIPDFLVDKPESANEIAGESLMFGNTLEFAGERPCLIKVHSVKEIRGHCAKGRSGVVSCVAGPYLHPEHQECSLVR